MREQFNPSTQRVLFNPATKRVLMVGGECDDCTDLGFETPAQIKITLAGILSCQGVGCCGVDMIQKNTGHGIGWDGSFIMEQGRIGITGGVPYRKDALPCWFGTMHYEDYGGFDSYHLEDCLGGVEGHSDYYIMVPTLLIHGFGDTYWVDVTVDLFYKGFQNYKHQIFLSASEVLIDPEGEFCIPYDTVIQNKHVCGLPNHVCAGDGTAILTPWPV